MHEIGHNLHSMHTHEVSGARESQWMGGVGFACVGGHVPSAPGQLYAPPRWHRSAPPANSIALGPAYPLQYCEWSGSVWAAPVHQARACPACIPATALAACPLPCDKPAAACPREPLREVQPRTCMPLPVPALQAVWVVPPSQWLIPATYPPAGAHSQKSQNGR